MAKYNNVIIDSGASVDVINYLVTLNPSRFIKTSDTEMTIDNECTFYFEWATNFSMGLKKDGTTLLPLGGSTYGGNLGIMSAVSEDFIYFRFCRNRNGSEDLPILLIIAKDNDNNFMYGGLNNNYDDIYSITFSNLTDDTSGYKLPKMINFTAPAGSVGYSSIAPLTANGQTIIIPKDLWSCSTLALHGTIALPNGKIYTNIGTNTMIELDS